jgi:hypothetical protein
MKYEISGDIPRDILFSVQCDIFSEDIAYITCEESIMK